MCQTHKERPRQTQVQVYLIQYQFKHTRDSAMIQSSFHSQQEATGRAKRNQKAGTVQAGSKYSFLRLHLLSMYVLESSK